MRNLLVLICVVFLAFATNDVSAYKILGIFHMVAPSHYIVGKALMQGLADDGHDVTVISPFKEKNPPPNYHEVYLDGILNNFQNDDEHAKKLFEMNNQYFSTLMTNMFEFGTMFTNVTLQHPRFQEFLKSDAKFDVVIVEIFVNEAFLALGHHFNAPVIGISPFGASKWTTDLVGTPNIPSYVPHTFNGFSDKMSFTERARNLFHYWYEDIAFSLEYLPMQQQLLDKYFPGKNVPTVRELRRNVSLVLLNTHTTLGIPRPYAPNMIEVGGMHVERVVKPLPANLQKFLDDATDGAIFFSLGSNIRFSKMPQDKRLAILKSFNEFPKMRLLLKLDEEVVIGSHKAGDVLIQNWLPQQSILAHPNVKLFVTHGGLLSTTESIFHGKPVVGIPVFGDQHLNMRLASIKGYGEGLPFEDFTETKFRELLRNVLSNPSYTKNANIISDRYRDQLNTPLETAVHWVKHVAKNKGAPHLRSVAVDLPFHVYYNLDIYFALLAIAFVLITAIKMVFSSKRSGETKIKQKRQ